MTENSAVKQFRRLRGWRGMAVVIAAVAGVLVAGVGTASAQLPPEGGGSLAAMIVTKAKAELAATTHNKEVPLGSSCNFYTGQVRSTPTACNGTSGYRVSAWCADFVNYVWKTQGADRYKIDGWAESLMWHGKARGTYHAKSGYTPKPGDAILYDDNPPYSTTWDSDGTPDIDHVGIVVAISGTTMTTIEGNWGDKVSQRTVDTSYSKIIGYTTPRWP